MTHECAQAERAYAEDGLDGNPPVQGKRADLANRNPYACRVCSASISALSDYGYYDYTMMATGDPKLDCAGDGDEPEWVAMCWGCRRAMAYYEDGLELPDAPHD